MKEVSFYFKNYEYFIFFEDFNEEEFQKQVQNLKNSKTEERGIGFNNLKHSQELKTPKKNSMFKNFSQNQKQFQRNFGKFNRKFFYLKYY